MRSTKSSTPHFDTLDELMDHIGDIPPRRIRMNPPPGTATEDDVIRAEGRFNRLCELVDGTLVEKPVGYYESHLALVLVELLGPFVREHGLGILVGESGMMRVAPKQVRMPDVAFYSWKQFPGRVLPRGSILDHVPDLAVEVLSPTNTKKEMARKRKEYFLGGCKLVWEIDPIKRTVRVYTAPDESKLVREKGTLDGGTVLPGFKLRVAELFEQAGRLASE
jgi:Uma2 family endonuclease